MDEPSNENGVVASLNKVARELLAKAGSSSSRRAARSVAGGADHRLRQSVVALVAGAELAEHNSPGEATLQVLVGRVELRADPATHRLGAGELVRIPASRHSLYAEEDSAVLLTVLPREYLE